MNDNLFVLFFFPSTMIFAPSILFGRVGFLDFTILRCNYRWLMIFFFPVYFLSYFALITVCKIYIFFCSILVRTMHTNSNLYDVWPKREKFNNHIIGINFYLF